MMVLVAYKLYRYRASQIAPPIAGSVPWQIQSSPPLGYQQNGEKLFKMEVWARDALVQTFLKIQSNKIHSLKNKVALAMNTSIGYRLTTKSGLQQKVEE